MSEATLRQHAAPAPSLTRWIHSYRQYDFGLGREPDFRSLPGTGAELWLVESGSLGYDGTGVGSGLLCLRSRRIVFQQSGLRVFAIRFRAGSLPFFIRQPLDRLIDRYTPLNAVFDGGLAAPLKASRGIADFQEQCHLADRLLLSCLHADRQLEATQQLASAMYEHSADFALTDYANELKRDRSHVSRQFRQTQGISAKHFHRLCRFERFLRDALFTPAPSLAGLAIDHGYFDQAHLTHEVRMFSQMPPRLLLTEKAARRFYSWRSANRNGDAANEK